MTIQDETIFLFGVLNQLVDQRVPDYSYNISSRIYENRMRTSWLLEATHLKPTQLSKYCQETQLLPMRFS